MEPRIQYAKTSDGVSIAFWVLGQGVPLVHMQGPPFSHIEVEWQVPEWRAWYERLARNTMLVRFDCRGCGLSQRGLSDYSPDTLLLDLEAVTDALSLRRFALYGTCFSGPLTIAYAARNPERVSRLLLWCAWASNVKFFSKPETQALAALINTHWGTFAETIAHVIYGWSEGEAAHRAALLIDEMVTPEDALMQLGQLRLVDVTQLLDQVVSPTLVLQPREQSLPDITFAQDLASGIPGARLVLVDGHSVVPALCDLDAVAAAVEGFLDDRETASAGPLTNNPNGLSERECQVLRLIVAGMSNDEIAEQLFVAPSTVKTHINNIYGKLDVTSRTRAVARARELNLA